MKVKNVSARAVTLRGKILVPGETYDVSDDFANDLRGVEHVEIIKAKAEVKAPAQKTEPKE